MSSTKMTHDPAVEQRTMQAITQDRYGSVDTLRLRDLPVPSFGDDEVLIEVHAAGVDQGVWHLMTGEPYVMRAMGFGFRGPKQSVLGLDASGVVVAVGAEVTRFAVGDEVFGIAQGAFAEYAVATESKLAHKPAAVSFEEAGAAAVSGITALQAISAAGLEAGQRVLVIGASGGVGSYAVQIARALGGRVTGVASGGKADLVASLGAERVIDYTTEDYLDGSVTYDVIIDTGGRNPVKRIRRALTETGTLVIVGGEGGGRWTGGIGRQIRATLLSPFISQNLMMFMSKEDHTFMEQLGRMMEAGQVVPAIGDRYHLADVPQAIQHLVDGKARGKSVITIGGSRNAG